VKKKRAEITVEHIQLSFEYGRKVHEGELERAKAINDLIAKTGMKKSSADAYVVTVGLLIEGTIYHWTLSSNAIEIYFRNIYDLFGDRGLSNAIKSVKLHQVYYAAFNKGKTNQKIQRHVERFENLRNPVSLIDYFAEANEISDQAQELPDEVLKARAEQAQIFPKRRQVTIELLNRNPYVKAYVLKQANGICGHCRQNAPFNKANGRPFLEVHHCTPLAEGGDDTIANTMALCPNCHREAHFGAEWQKFRAIYP
jgi:5-methylcytosine-specific restriction enzyme A